MENNTLTLESNNTSGKMKYIIPALLVLFLVVLAIFLYTYFLNKKSETQKIVTNPSKSLNTTKADYTKKIFKENSIPLEFSQEVTLPKGISLEQGYVLQYPTQKQITVVFASTKSMQENYLYYSGFLTKENWDMFNNYQGDTVSSLYANKGNVDINITVSKTIATSTKASVSISIFGK